jgi:hypothetical protein
MSFIRRIADAEKWRKERREEIEYLFSQFGMINKLRNDILHYGATDLATGLAEPEEWLLSNELFAHTADRIRQMHITPRLLEDAAADLLTISVRLGILGLGNALSARHRATLRSVLGGAWRYKPPPPATPARRTRRTRQARRSPPRSSRA